MLPISAGGAAIRQKKSALWQTKGELRQTKACLTAFGLSHSPDLLSYERGHV